MANNKVPPKMIFSALLILFSFNLPASADWTDTQYQESIMRLKKNISPKGTSPGAVIASPSKADPDYFFHWVRDAAIVMNTLGDLGEWSYFYDYVELTKTNQKLSGPNNLGEPKYEVDGRPFTGPWGRPQNDGPALRALSMIRFARHLLNTGKIDYVKTNLYDGQLPTTTVIKVDLEYVSRQWHRDSFDLWEEIRGDHFYTRAAQYGALVEGARLANELGDFGAASWYQTQADYLAHRIEEHFQKTDFIQENLNRTDGISYKDSRLDVATILALLHVPTIFNLIAIDDIKVQNTFWRIDNAFAKIYAVNAGKDSSVGHAIGRYPEDQYYGGNPWFLTTLAMAEYQYRIAKTLNFKGQNRVSVSACDVGDRYLERVRLHKGPDGQMDEQFDRNSGYQRSARDLTWSYSAFITTYLARKDCR